MREQFRVLDLTSCSSVCRVNERLLAVSLTSPIFILSISPERDLLLWNHQANYEEVTPEQWGAEEIGQHQMVLPYAGGRIRRFFHPHFI